MLSSLSPTVLKTLKQETFGDFVEFVGRNLARGELTFSTGGVQASFPFACGTSTTVEVELSRRQSWTRDAGELH
jgi:hypothetical protein